MSVNLHSKKILFIGWGCENPRDTYAYQLYYLLLKKIFSSIKTFDTKKEYFRWGREKMNLMLLDRLKKEEFDLLLFSMDNDELDISALAEIRNIYPHIKKVILVSDDDAKFDSWSKYYALFFNDVITSQPYIQEYKKEGLNAFFHLEYNPCKLKPMKIKKIYDVTFTGRPKADRNEAIKYLVDNKINVNLFGWDWYKYEEFKKIYLGSLSQEDYVKVINQSKINLSPSKAGHPEEKNHYNMKGRFFEVALCNAFQLIEDSPTLHNFFNKDEIATYSSLKEMLEKVNYYLKHEKEREKIAEKTYKKVLKDYNREKQLTGIFVNILKKEGLKELPVSSKKTITLTRQDFENLKKLKEKIKDYDFIAFKNENLSKSSNLKEYLLSRALETTDKPVACCDYYVSSLGIENYVLFASKFAFKRIGKEAGKLADINSLMVKKDFFLKNFSVFCRLLKGEPLEFINESNASFVSIPLVTLKKINKIDYEKMKKAVEMKFPHQLFSLMFKKKLFTSSYAYLLVLKSLTGEAFILRYLFELIKDKNNRDRLSLNSAYAKAS